MAIYKGLLEYRMKYEKERDDFNLVLSHYFKKSVYTDLESLISKVKLVFTNNTSNELLDIDFYNEKNEIKLCISTDYNYHYITFKIETNFIIDFKHEIKPRIY